MEATPPESRTFTVSAPQGGTARPDIQATVQNSRNAKPPADGAVERKRQAVHAATHAQHAAEAAAENEAPTDAAPVRENLESVEIQLPDGRLVHFGPPQGVALQMRIAMILGQQLNEYTAGLVKTVMSVRSIAGQPVQPIGNMVDVQKVANMLGEDGVDLLMVANATFWPAVTLADLRVVKKNLRG